MRTSNRAAAAWVALLGWAVLRAGAAMAAEPGGGAASRPTTATRPATGTTLASTQPAVRFNTNFEGASLGKIEATGDGAYRLHVRGQYDERGRNRQASWYAFRIDQAAGRALALTLTDFVGEYNDKPGAVPMGPDIVPVWSDDGERWQPFERSAATWDADTKELTLRFTPAADRVWVAHVPPYTPARLTKLLAEVDQSPAARIEVIGKTVGGRDLVTVTVTDPAVADDAKRVVWLQARQHAWEAGTSWVMEGALRFATSDDPAAIALRRRAVLRFTPMVDWDGAAAGGVRFNANGFDVNRNWDVVDLRDKRWLARCPEIWYTKKAILAEAGRIDLMVNMHNTETGEYVQTQADDEAVLRRMRRFEGLLVANTSYDPSRRLTVGRVPGNTTNRLWLEGRVPVLLMEQRIATSKKLGRRPTVEDRLAFGRGIVEAMVEAVAE